MADQAKLHSPIHSIFQSVGYVACGQALSWGRIRPFLFTNASCRCTFWCISLICRAYSSDVMVLPRFKKLQWIRLAADYQTDHDPHPCFVFLVQVWFWKVLWSFFSILTELGIMLSSKSHFSYVPIQSRNGSVLLHRIREDST